MLRREAGMNCQSLPTDHCSMSQRHATTPLLLDTGRADRCRGAHASSESSQPPSSVHALHEQLDDLWTGYCPRNHSQIVQQNRCCHIDHGLQRRPNRYLHKGCLLANSSYRSILPKRNPQTPAHPDQKPKVIAATAYIHQPGPPGIN